MTTPENHAREEQIKTLLEKISAYVEQFHGGSVEYVSFDGNKLEVRLGGACLGCPLLPSTLQGWVAGTVHHHLGDRRWQGESIATLLPIMRTRRECP